jgi:putative DNA primase/helicase
LLWNWQFPATCNHGGAGKWKPELVRWFQDAHVVILPDADKAGTDHLHSVARQLCGTAATIRYLELPDLPPKGDVVDWAANGGTREELDRLIRDEAKEWEAPDPNVPPQFSDESIALEFAERYKNLMRYVAKWGKWFIFGGRRWSEDQTLQSFDYSRHLCREFAATAQPEVAYTIASSAKVAAVERLSKADRKLAATVDQWDKDPFAFNNTDGLTDIEKSHLKVVKESA